MSEQEKRQFSLSPSAWNRWEACPRQYWLSRQKLPRKTGMAAALGTAVHASIEDLVAVDLTGKESSEAGWLPSEMERVLRARWEEEKVAFHATPRHPDWKEDKFGNARKQQLGGVELLLRHAGAPALHPSVVSVALWRRIQSLVIACEGELRTTDGRLMGRLDLLLADVDGDGKVSGWKVADLKTGRTPDGKLSETVRRQLLLYRDILLSNNTDHPPVSAEGWYTDGPKVYVAEGDSVLEQAYAAWQEMDVTETPMKPTPGEDTCGGFCDWKAWCPHWWTWRKDSGKLHAGNFADAVVLVENFEPSGAAVIELCEPADEAGRPQPTGVALAAIFEGNAKIALEKLLTDGYQGAVFIGGVMTSGRVWRIGGWCDVLPWSPIADHGDEDQTS